jgi:hypothetical protein
VSVSTKRCGSDQCSAEASDYRNSLLRSRTDRLIHPYIRYSLPSTSCMADPPENDHHRACKATRKLFSGRSSAGETQDQWIEWQCVAGTFVKPRIYELVNAPITSGGVSRHGGPDGHNAGAFKVIRKQRGLSSLRAASFMHTCNPIADRCCDEVGSIGGRMHSVMEPASMLRWILHGD